MHGIVHSVEKVESNCNDVGLLFKPIYQGRKHPRIKGGFSYGPGRLKMVGAVYYFGNVFILKDGSMN